MANTCAVAENFDADSAYKQSFGHMANKTTYQSPNLKSFCKGEPTFDYDARTSLNKAFTTGLKAHNTETGGAGTAGFAMIPIFVDPQIVDETRKNTPIVEMVPRVTNNGMFADFNNITAKGGAFTRAEDAALSETDTTYDRYSTEIKFLYAVGAVSSFADQSAPNSKQQEVLVKTREIRELEENLIVNGNKTTSGISGNPNGTEYDGFITLQGTTNKVDKNTTALDLADIDTAIQNAFDDGGRPNAAFCSSAVFTDLLGLLNKKIGYLQPAAQTAWGFTAITLHTMVGMVPVVPSMFMSNVSGSKAMYFFQLTGNMEMRVLQDLTYEDLAHTNDSEKFMLKIYECLIIRNTAFNAFIGEIA